MFQERNKIIIRLKVEKYSLGFFVDRLLVGAEFFAIIILVKIFAERILE